MFQLQLLLLCVLQIVNPSFQTGYPDLYLKTPEIIRSYGYPAETHTIETIDGYLLNIHRIPHGKSSNSPQIRPVILLQHGILGSSTDWVISGPGHALSFLLADIGYDVWMGNSRGNTNSRAHTTLNPNFKTFWKFSWDEMALYDLPAVIDYIINETNQQKITYVGHSLGTTIFFALMSARPEYNAKFKAMIGLAPIVYLKHMRSPLRLLTPFTNQIEFLQKLIGTGELLPQNKLAEYLGRYVCESSIEGKAICENLLFILVGFDKEQLNDELLAHVISYAPAGTSSLTAIQFLQQIISGRFCSYDFGKFINQIKYNSSLPPLYNLENVQVPVALFYGDNDLFVDQRDFKHLTDQLPNIIETYRVPYKKFNHVDFLYAMDAPKLVYKEVVRILSITTPIYNSYQVMNLNDIWNL